jgi:folylpolyglutamate synthase/dihydropteroate synthase
MKILGNTLVKIAVRSGIIKPGVPVIVTSQKKSVENVICSVAESKESPVIKSHNLIED